MDKLTAEVNELKHKYNELRHIARIRQKELTMKNDELRDLERDSARTSSDNPLARVRSRHHTHIKHTRTHTHTHTHERDSANRIECAIHTVTAIP